MIVNLSKSRFLVIVWILSSLLVFGDAPPFRQFRILSWGTKSGSDTIYYRDNEQDVPVSLSGDGLSPFYEYEGPDSFDFYKLGNGTDGQQTHVSVAHVDLSLAGDFPLLIISPDSNNANMYSVISIRDDLQAVPSGGIELFNFLKKSVTVKVGTDSISLEPQESKLAQVKQEGGHALYVEVTSDSGRLYGNNWGYFPSLRTLVFIVQDPHSATIEVKRVTESDSVLASQPYPKRSFRVIGNLPSGKKTLSYAYMGKEIAISGNWKERSPFYFYQGPNTFDLINSRAPMCHVDITKAGRWPLLIINHDNKDTNKYVVITEADDFIDFPISSTEWVNMTEAAITVKAPSGTFDLSAGGSRVIANKSVVNSKNIVDLVIDSKVVYSLPSQYSSDIRTLAFIVREGDGNIAVKTVIESKTEAKFPKS